MRPPTLHRVLTAALARRGTTQTDIAKAVGEDRSLLSRWLSGDRIPSHAQLDVLLSALDADPDTRRRAWAAMLRCSVDALPARVGLAHDDTHDATDATVTP